MEDKGPTFCLAFGPLILGERLERGVKGKVGRHGSTWVGSLTYRRESCPRLQSGTVSDLFRYSGRGPPFVKSEKEITPFFLIKYWTILIRITSRRSYKWLTTQRPRTSISRTTSRSNRGTESSQVWTVFRRRCPLWHPPTRDDLGRVIHSVRDTGRYPRKTRTDPRLVRSGWVFLLTRDDRNFESRPHYSNSQAPLRSDSSTETPRSEPVILQTLKLNEDI